MRICISLSSLFIAALMFFQPTAATAATTLSLSNWQATGSQIWRINFPGYNSAMTDSEKANLGTSELYYPQQGTYATINYDAPLSPKHKVSLEVGVQGALTPSTGTDSDWDYSRSENLWHYGVFQTNGSSTLVNLDFKHSIVKDTEFFYGYGYSNSNFLMSQGYYSIIDYTPVNTSLPNLHSSYSLAYHGPHIGLTSTKQLTPNLALTGTLSYSPLSVAQGHGIWNLRDLDFRHLGTGQMLDSKIALRLNIAGRRDNSLTVGYRYQHYSLYTGAENTSDQITWTKATKIQQGWYMGGDFRF